ncbi:hypothetical protein [Gimesia sp.]|uniref:hypothetical protein n=1 Tax=Gimesia sp. TaxID=2024833 RepID=UPI003A8FDAA5
MLIKANHVTRPETKQTRFHRNRVPHKLHAIDETISIRTDPVPQKTFDDWVSSYSESSMIFRSTLILVLLGITPLLLFLLVLYLVPDFLHIDITP